jgi:CDGSH-type Zn-finger protein
MNESLPKIATKSSFKIEVEKGKTYSWCPCGFSKNQPFCDGSHKDYKNADGSIIMRSMKFEATETKTVALCGCKHSKNPPFCDGTHSSL